MDAIAENVYIEDRYLGVTLGVITQTRGLIQIDAPPSPEDGRAWRASLMGMGNGPERVGGVRIHVLEDGFYPGAVFLADHQAAMGLDDGAADGEAQSQVLV